MQCAEFENRLNRLLDQRRSPEHDASLQAHAVICSRCELQLETQAALFESLYAPQLESNLVTDNVVQQIEKRRRAERATWASIVVTLAASLAIIGFLVVQSGSNETAQQIAANEELRDVSKGESLIGLGSETSTDITSEIDWSTFAEFMPLNDSFASISSSSAIWIDGVTGTFKPLTASMSSALNVIRRTMPLRTSAGDTPGSDVLPQASNFSDDSAHV